MSQKPMIKKDAAVSPVVGVMLMIVVTIIIAALVSGMAGGLITGVQKTPSIVVDVGVDHYTQFRNTYTTLTLDVLSVSEPIKSSDVEISLTVMNKTGYHAAGVDKAYPFSGSGTGISNLTDGSNIFGNFTIFAGTSISGDVYIQNQTVHNFTTIYNARHDEAIADEVPVDDITARPMTWGGKLDSDSKYSDYNKLGNSRGTTEVLPYGMVLLKPGWVLSNKNPWNLTETTYDIGINTGDTLGITMVYLPAGQTLYSGSLVVR